MASLAACMDGIDQPDAHFRISYMDVIVCVVLNGTVKFVDQDAICLLYTSDAADD